MALSFLYLAFVRLRQLFRLIRRDSSDLAVEVVVLRNEVAVLQRKVARPKLVDHSNANRRHRALGQAAPLDT